MFEFIFNTRSERLSRNPRQYLGKSSKKTVSMGSRHDSWQQSWQQSFNKRTLGATSSCGNCSYIDCANNYVNCVSNTDNSCQWKCVCSGSSQIFYCNGTPPQSPF